MSEDEDERMDRARRIRKMREGQRSGDDADDPADAGDGSDEEPTTDGESVEQESAAESDTDPEPSGDDDADRTDEAGDTEPVERATDEGSADADPTDDDPADTAEQGSETVVDEAATEADAVEQREEATERPATAGDAERTRADGAERSQEDSMNDDTSASDTDVSNDDGAPDPQAIAQRAAEAAASVGNDDAEAAQAASNGGAVEEAAAAIQGATGVELPDQEQIEAAMESGDDEAGDAGEEDDTAPAPSGVDSETTTTEESTRVLEFTLGDEYYCIDISLVEEIVKRDTITRVPNTDDYIEGVVDLRGQITTILDPKELLDIDAEGSESLIIVFDPEAFEDQGAIGWLVDEVRQVAPILESEVNDPPVKEDYIHGVVDREEGDEFVIWTKPEVAITLATADDEEE